MKDTTRLLDIGVQSLGGVMEEAETKVMVIAVTLKGDEDGAGQVTVAHKGYHSRMDSDEFSAMMVGVHNQLKDFFVKRTEG